MTQRGVILGTAAYMSPEQARGKTVDTRADIWAFGCVLFEMLTGRRAFEDEDVSMTLSKVLRPSGKRPPSNFVTFPVRSFSWPSGNMYPARGIVERSTACIWLP
jgi:serine/threonine protein kinase